MTLVFSPTQALMAAKVGAAYVSPFVGRLDDIATSAWTWSQEIVEIYDNYEFATEVLVASVRHPMHISRGGARWAPTSAPVPRR